MKMGELLKDFSLNYKMELLMNDLAINSKLIIYEIFIFVYQMMKVTNMIKKVIFIQNIL